MTEFVDNWRITTTETGYPLRLQIAVADSDEVTKARLFQLATIYAAPAHGLARMVIRTGDARAVEAERWYIGTQASRPDALPKDAPRIRPSTYQNLLTAHSIPPDFADRPDDKDPSIVRRERFYLPHSFLDIRLFEQRIDDTHGQVRLVAERAYKSPMGDAHTYNSGQQLHEYLADEIGYDRRNLTALKTMLQFPHALLGIARLTYRGLERFVDHNQGFPPGQTEMWRFRYGVTYPQTEQGQAATTG